MIRNLSFWFCLAVFCQLVGSTDCQWHCGSGSVSEKLAWALTFNSDRDSELFSRQGPYLIISEINGCCKQHDKDYEMVEKGLWPWSRRYADLLFGSCLEKVCSSLWDYFKENTPQFSFQLRQVHCQTGFRCCRTSQFLALQNTWSFLLNVVLTGIVMRLWM